MPCDIVAVVSRNVTRHTCHNHGRGIVESLARTREHPHVGVAFEQHVVGPVHVEQSEWSKRVGHTRRLWQVPQPTERSGQALHGRVVGGLRSLAQREQAVARAVVGLEPLRVDHPVFPTDICEVEHQLFHSALVHASKRDRVARVHGLHNTQYDIIQKN